MKDNYKKAFIISVMIPCVVMVGFFLKSLLHSPSIADQIAGDPQTLAMLEAFAGKVMNPDALDEFLHPSLPKSFLKAPIILPSLDVGPLEGYHGIRSLSGAEDVMALPQNAGAEIAALTLGVHYQKAGDAVLHVQLRRDKASANQWKVSTFRIEPEESIIFQKGYR